MNGFLETISPLTSLISVQAWIAFFVGLAGLAFGWIAGGFLKRSLLRMSPPAGYSTLFVSLAADIVKTGCICIGLLFFAGAVGINIGLIVKLIALLGVGVGFIFKDLLSDIVSGFFIVAHKPFSVGLEITVAGDKGVYTGRIKSIDLRYVTLENSIQTIMVPNSFLFRQPLCISKNK